MKKIYVYAGYYELFITDKEMPKPYVLLEDFNNVPDAESYAEDLDEWMWLDRDLIPDSFYCWDGDDFDTHTFDMDEMIKSVWY